MGKVLGQPWGHEFNPIQNLKSLGRVHAYNSSTGYTKTGGLLGLAGQPVYLNPWGLVSVRDCLKQQNREHLRKIDSVNLWHQHIYVDIHMYS